MFGFINYIPEFVKDALKDSISLIPFLFIIFVLIEIFESYFSHKINTIVKYSKGIGPIVGAIVAVIPQCGFSVIASTLYIKKFISAGTLLAVYIATSDEAIPVLLASPNQFYPMIKIIFIKCILAIIVGYFVDFTLAFFFKNKQDYFLQAQADIEDDEKGCCGHAIKEKRRVRFILHPLKHTAHVFVFILAVCLILNYMFEVFGTEAIQNNMLQNSLFQPVLTGLFGLIPNCATSIIITMMFINGVISLGSTVAGLSSAAGLGLLVLIRKNTSRKNTACIILTLLTFSILAGILIQMFI